MNSCSTLFAKASALAVMLVCAVSAGAQNLPAPEITPSRHLQFTPQPGTAWYLDGSSDGQTWTEQAGPFFATGAAVNHFLPAGAAARFRLRYVDPATVGHAPAVVAGTSLIMEKAGAPLELFFMNPVRAIFRMDETHAHTFTYEWLKTSPNGGEAILTRADGSLALLRLEFLDNALGRWGMEEIPDRAAAARITQTLDGGAFSFRPGRFRRNVQIAALPVDLDGRSMVFNEAGRLMHVKFEGESALTVKTSSGAVLTGTYAYDPEDRRHGRLSLFMGDSPLSLDLTLQAPGTGTFKDVPDAGASSRTGTFTLPEEQEPPPNPDCPPPSLSGLTFVINDSAPCTLNFFADGTGMISKEVNGAVQTTTFLYSYNSTGGRSAKVSLTFPGGSGDAIDEYDMTWNDDCTGEFERSSFQNGTASGKDSGTFGPGGLAGLFRSPPPGLGM